MSKVSTDRVVNGMPTTKHQAVAEHGNLNPNIEPSMSSSQPADFDSCAPESVVALRNAYSILRDRYNKLKLEHHKLQKQLQKITEPISKKKLQKSNAKAGSNDSLKELAGPHDNKVTMQSGIQVSVDEPLSAGTLITELEQLRERLDKMSREAQSYVDTDLKDMMENVIPKLKELERQCSNLSDEGPRSLTLLRAKETQVKSFVSQNTDEEIPAKQETSFLTPNQSLSDDLQPSIDLQPSSSLSSASLYQSYVDLVGYLLSSTSSQSNDLQHIYEMLAQQNEKLKRIDSKPANRRNIPDEGFANDSPGVDWSLIPNC